MQQSLSFFHSHLLPEALYQCFSYYAIHYHNHTYCCGSVTAPHLTVLPAYPAASGTTTEGDTQQQRGNWATVDSNVDPALRTIIIKDLLPSKYYQFRMMAVNRVNESLPSDAAPKQAIKMPAQRKCDFQ